MESRHFHLIDRHPDAERFDALTFGLLNAMVGLAFAALVVGLTQASGVVSTILFAAGLAPGAFVTARWLARRRSKGIVYVRNIAPGWHSTVQAMTTDANNILAFVEHTPPGPIFDHLCEVHRAASGAVARCVARAELASDNSVPDVAVLTDREELRRLVDAAQKLRVTHESTLLHRPLCELTEQTNRIRAALEADDLHSPSITGSTRR